MFRERVNWKKLKGRVSRKKYATAAQQKQLTVSTAFMMGVLSSSSALTQLGSAPLARASNMTGRFLASAALYSRRFGSSLLMSSHDVVGASSTPSSPAESSELSSSSSVEEAAES